jgi:bifunctional enzyme CysN/CysC
VLETSRPIACDIAKNLAATGRFVLVDHYEIAGCGVVLGAVAAAESLLDRRVRARDFAWDSGVVTRQARAQQYGHQGKFILFAVGGDASEQTVTFAEELAHRLEAVLFDGNKRTYYLSMANLTGELLPPNREEHVQRLGEIARVITDAGLLFLSLLSDAEDAELTILRALNHPAELFVIRIGQSFGLQPVSLELEPTQGIDAAVQQVLCCLGTESILLDYAI